MASKGVLYVFDTSSLAVLENYYPDRFGSFWKDLTALSAAKRMHSVSEVRKELPTSNTRDFLLTWLDGRDGLFPTPTADEGTFVRGIFVVPKFQALVKQKSRLTGTPVADPWVIARAATLGATLVTEESVKPELIRIPAVCKHFKIPCVNVERLMADEGWKY